MRNLIFALLLLVPGFGVAQDSVVTSPLKVITVTPTVDTSAYAAGDVLQATTLTLTGACKTGKTAIIQDVVIPDLAAQTANLEAIFFNSAIASFGAINAAFDPADADLLAYFQAAVLVDTHSSFNDSSVNYAKNAGRVVRCDTNGDLYLVLVARAAATFAAATDLKVRVSFLQ